MMARYRSINSYLREQFGEKVYKLSLDGGFTCPTRDGTKGTRGCIFCSGGSGDFSIPVENDVYQAIETAKSLVAGKGAKKYIAMMIHNNFIITRNTMLKHFLKKEEAKYNTLFGDID